MNGSWIVFQGFLQNCNQEKQKALLACLPQETQTLLHSLPPTMGDVTKGIDSTEILDQVHYSWLAPIIRMHTEDEVRLFLSALSEKQVKGLKKTLLLTNHLYPLSRPARKFVREQLTRTFLETEEILPQECLPEDPLNELTKLSTEQLKDIATFLGIRDLSQEMRLIIDNLKIKQIINALSQHEQLYLKSLMQQTEAITFRKMGLANWDGSAQTLKNLLLQRGINRLAKALYGHDKSLLWHVAHKFDTELGKTLVSLCTPVESERGSAILGQQLLDLIPYIQNLKT